MTALKICGLRPDDDLSFVNSPTVSHVSTMFVPASKRFVTPTQAAGVVAAVGRKAVVMGVFANQPLHEVQAALSASRAAGAQLHGDEPPATCKALRSAGILVWKSFSVPGRAADPEAAAAAVWLQMEPYLAAVDGVLLDAAPPRQSPAGATGGHGKTFDWTVLPYLLQRLRAQSTTPVWVAGGLTPENVGELLNLCQPDGIDVSSGVEEDGRKSPRKIMDMTRAVESHG